MYRLRISTAPVGHCSHIGPYLLGYLLVVASSSVLPSHLLPLIRSTMSSIVNPSPATCLHKSSCPLWISLASFKCLTRRSRTSPSISDCSRRMSQVVGSSLIRTLSPSSSTVFSLFGWGPSSNSSPTFLFCLRTQLGTREKDNLFFRQAWHACVFPADAT